MTLRKRCEPAYVVETAKVLAETLIERVGLPARLFPQVVLSMFGVAMLRDTRTDPLDPEGGLFLAAVDRLLQSPERL